MTRLIPLLLVLIAPTLTGCFYSREIVRVKNDLEAQYPEAEFDRTVMVRMGAGTFRTLGFLARLTPDEQADEIGGYLRDIDVVKLGVYEVDHLPPRALTTFPELPRFQRGGWEVALKVRDEDEVMWLLYRERETTVRDLYVLVLDYDTLVILRFKGYLEGLLARVLAEDDAVEDMVDCEGFCEIGRW